MFNWIRRHRWLASLFILLVCASFVIFFSASSSVFGTNGIGNIDRGSMNGVPISEERFMSAYAEALLNYRLRNGDWPSGSSSMQGGGFDEIQETYNRLMMIQRLEDLKIQPDDKSVAKWIAQVFRDPETEKFNPEIYNRFIDQILPTAGIRRGNGGLTKADFERYVRHQVGIQHLVELESISGLLVSPEEARALYKEDNKQVQGAIVFFSNRDYLDKVLVDPLELGTFYTNRLSLYRIQERYQVDYVRFDASNFVSQAATELNSNTNLNQLLDLAYLQQGTNTFKDKDGIVLSADAAKAEIRQQMMDELSLVGARRAAGSFAQKLFDKEPYVAANLKTVAAAEGIEVKTTAPFEAFSTPAGLSVSRNFTTTATQLTVENPFSRPLPEGKSVFILAYNRVLPYENPPLSQVEERVTADFKDSKAREAARVAGNSFYQTATNLLAQGKSLTEIAQEQNVTLVELPTFTQSTTTLVELRGQVQPSRLYSLANTLKEGEISSYSPTSSGGFVFQLKSMSDPDDAKIAENIEEFTKTLTQQREMEAFNQWFRKQQELARFTRPYAGESTEDTTGNPEGAPSPSN